MSRPSLLVPLFVLTSLLCASSMALAEERKEVAKRADCVITVGDRDADGNDLVLADCEWPLPAAAVIAVVSVAEKHDDYLSSVAESSKLPDGRVLQVHAASGISDRQITLDYTNEQRPDGSFKTSWTRAAKQEPLRDGLVDAPMDDGFWEVVPEGDATCKVRYGLRYDAGGRVPTWLVRAFQKGGIGDILEEMRAAATKR